MIPVPQSVLEKLAGFYKTTTDQLTHFGGGEEMSDGVVYAYPHEDTRRLLKIMPIPKKGQRVGLLCFEERLQFVRYLGENGANIVFPKRSPAGNLYESTTDDNHVWVGYSMELIPGKPKMGKAWDIDFFRKWGQVIGLNHRLAKEYPSWESIKDPETGDDLLTWRGEWNFFNNWCKDEDVKAKWVEIKEQLEKLPVNRDSFGFIHNDPHIENILVRGDQVTLIDFDVANHHWLITDISIACQHILAFTSGGMGGPVHHREKLLEFLACFMEGYSKENKLFPEWLNRLDLFIAYRRILMFIGMKEWLMKSQPKLHDSWKKMIMTQPEVVGEWC